MFFVCLILSHYVFVCVCCIKVNFLIVTLTDYVVEIAPREGLFSSSQGREGVEQRRRPQQRPRAQVSNPPELRMPRGAQSGTGSEVRT